MASAATPSVRAAVEADLPFLIELRRATMTPHLARQGVAVDDEQHRERAATQLGAAAIIEVDGQPAGVIKVLQDGTTWTIDQFQIAPQHQGRGLGTTVLRALIADARASGSLLRLSVLKQNPAARLYARLGFRTLSESASSYKMTFIETEAPSSR
jgi:ribosomal protein S18 acetylase RimI-like enzyme